MSQKIKIQDGRVVYEAAPIPDEPSTTPVPRELDFNVKGIVNVTKEVNVGDDLGADGLITTPANLSLYISPGRHLNFVTDNGNITLNGSTWPTNGPITTGMFLGATSTNNLAFLSFIIGTAPTDFMTSAQLDALYPQAQYGQQVIGPNSIYQKVSAGQWRDISALTYTPVNRAGDTMTGFLTLNANPTSPLHASTKQYVDNVAQGLVAKPAALAATTTNLVSTYNNGTAGVGATLTSTSNGVWPGVDGVTTGWAIGSGVLVKNQTNLAQNGRYYVSSLGSASTPWVLTRCTYCDTAAEIPGAYVFVQDGTQEATGWIQVVNDPTTFVVGTDPIYVYQFSGAGTYLSGNGIGIVGNTISNTGVLSNLSGSNISVSSATGNVTINLVSNPSINGTNFTNIPNSALINDSLTIGSTTITLGGTSTALAGLTSVTATTFNGAFSGNSTSAGSLAITNDTTTATAVYPVWSNGTSGNQALEVSNTKLSFVPSTGILTATGFSGSGANLTNIPNAGLVNDSVTLGSTEVFLGATETVLTGLTSVTSTNFYGTFVGPTSGNATTATTATNANNVAIVNDVVTATAVYPVWANGTSGNQALEVSNTKLSFVPSTGILTATGFSGSGASLTGIPNAGLVNDSVTLGSTEVFLGSTATVLTGLTSVTSTNFYGTFNGTITGGTTTGDTTFQEDVTIQGNLYRSVQTGITSAGATLATATDLTKDINVVSSVAASTGVALPVEIVGATIIVMNMGANTLNVYPSVGTARIDSLALGAAFTLPVGAKIMFICVSATQWYTLNATYA